MITPSITLTLCVHVDFLPQSRVSAAIPSGVGFLGAASIWKGTRPSSGPDGASGTPEVHGLTTATSVWLSSAVGILVGGALYAPALFTTAISVVYLRFAPRLRRGGDEGGAAADDATAGARTSAVSPDTPSAARSTRPSISAPSPAAGKDGGDLEALRVPLMQAAPMASNDSETKLVL